MTKAVFEQKGQSFDNSKRLKVNDARVKVGQVYNFSFFPLLCHLQPLFAIQAVARDIDNFSYI